MKLVGALLVISILFLYAPVMSREECSGENHMEGIRINCGYSFHCPFVDKGEGSGYSRLPFLGQFAMISPVFYLHQLVHLVYRPPEI